MAKFKDQSKASTKPKVSRFIPGEPAKRRHVRRLGENMSAQDKAFEWAEKHGLLLRISNQGHHWSFYEFDVKQGEPQLFEWWPSSAKMVIKKQWDQGVHVHDVYQLMNEAESRLAQELEQARVRKDVA